MIGAGLVLAAMVLAGICCVRIARGPSLYDRLLGAHVVITLVTLAVAGLGAVAGQVAYVFAAAALMSANLTLSLLVRKLYRQGSLQPGMAPANVAPTGTPNLRIVSERP